MFLPNSFEKVYPARFLKVYLVMIAIAGSLILIQTAHYPFDDFGSLLMLSVCALVIHERSRLNYRRYLSGDSEEPLQMLTLQHL